MNANVRRIAEKSGLEMLDAVASLGLPVPIVGKPVQLSPIPWGKPDPALGRALCRHIAEFTPPVLIPCNPFTESKTRRALRSLHVFHY